MLEIQLRLYNAQFPYVWLSWTWKYQKTTHWYPESWRSFDWIFSMVCLLYWSYLRLTRDRAGCIGLERKSDESLSVSVPSGSDTTTMMVQPSPTIPRFIGKKRELSNEAESEHEQARSAINHLALPQLSWPPRRCASENGAFLWLIDEHYPTCIVLAADYSTYSSIYSPNTLAWCDSHRALSSDQFITFNSGYGPDLLPSSGASEVLYSPMPNSNGHPGYPRSDHSGVLSTDYSTTSNSGHHVDYLGLDHSSRITPTNYATTSGSGYLPNYSNWNDFRTEPSANYAITPSSMYSASSHSTAQTAPTTPEIANVSRSQSKTLRSKGRYVCETCNNSFTAAHNLKSKSSATASPGNVKLIFLCNRSYELSRGIKAI